MGIENIKPLNLHYSFCAVPSQYDEESLTALELCGRTAQKLNEVIKLLLETCKEQNMTIDEAVDYMKDNITDTTIRYLYELAAAGEIGILEEENYNAIRKNITTIVNVKEYGAKGDGVTDDTQAFIDALNAGVNIYIPAGVYVISDGLTLDKYYHIYGEGAGRTTIKFTGETVSGVISYLITVNTLYSMKPLIENIAFTGGDNGFLYCSRGGWGASVSLRDCTVKEFARSTMWAESAFMLTVENCVFDSASPITFTTYDGVYNEDNFSNCITFKNCLHVGAKEQEHNAFNLNNVRVITFESCVFEHLNTMLCVRNKTQTIKLNNCWFEDIATLSNVNYWCDIPVLNNPNLVNVDKFVHHDMGGLIGPASYDIYDKMDGAPYLLDITGNTDVTVGAFQADALLSVATVYNPADAYSQYFHPYAITTSRAMFNVPVNMYYDVFEHTDNTVMPTHHVTFVRHRPVSCPVYYKIKLVSNYADGDYIVTGVDIFKDKFGTYKIIKKEELYRNTWLNSSGEVDTINFNLVENGAFEYSTSGKRCVRTEFFVEWNFCGKKGTIYGA